MRYDSGVVRQLDTLVRSNILYGAKQSAQQYQKYIGEQFGADGCEIDYHPHPRPSHGPMGGVMFTYAKEPVTIDGVTYPSFYKPYKGEKSPEDLLNEYGCLHFATDVILGISEPTWDKKELERRKAEDKELIEYTVKKERNGEVTEQKTLYKTRYDWSQKQRELERMAREEKRQAHFSKACGNNIKARQHEENLQQIKTAYNDLCEKTGLTPTPERMAVYKSAKGIDFGGKSGIMKVGTNTPSSLGVMINGKTASAPIEIEKAVKGANPNYAIGKEYQTNCQRCVQTYDFRRRGYDVEALPSPTKNNTVIWGNECYVDSQGNKPDFKFFLNESDVKKEINNSPDGSRHTIYITWKNNRSSHVFIAEKENGTVRYLDPQTGSLDVIDYFKEGKKRQFGLLRTDDKGITSDMNIINATMK